MIALTKSDLADLGRYPASLQQAARALWGQGLPRRAQTESHKAAGNTPPVAENNIVIREFPCVFPIISPGC